MGRQRKIAAVQCERNIASVVARHALSVLRRERSSLPLRAGQGCDEAIPSYEETASFLAVTLVSYTANGQ